MGREKFPEPDVRWDVPFNVVHEMFVIGMVSSELKVGGIVGFVYFYLSSTVSLRAYLILFGNEVFLTLRDRSTVEDDVVTARTRISVVNEPPDESS